MPRSSRSGAEGARRDGQGREGSDDEASQVGGARHGGNEDREGRIDTERHREQPARDPPRCRQLLRTLQLEQQRRADQPAHDPRRADGVFVACERSGSHGADRRCGHDDRRPARSEGSLDETSEHPEAENVQREVSGARVEEVPGDDPPVLSGEEERRAEVAGVVERRLELRGQDEGAYAQRHRHASGAQRRAMPRDLLDGSHPCELQAAARHGSDARHERTGDLLRRRLVGELAPGQQQHAPAGADPQPLRSGCQVGDLGEFGEGLAATEPGGPVAKARGVDRERPAASAQRVALDLRRKTLRAHAETLPHRVSFVEVPPATGRPG